MISGECAYACAAKENNGTGTCQDNGSNNGAKKVYICVKETNRKTCPYVNNYCACVKYEPR